MRIRLASLSLGIGRANQAGLPCGAASAFPSHASELAGRPAGPLSADPSRSRVAGAARHCRAPERNGRSGLRLTCPERGLYSDDWAFASVAEHAGSPVKAFDALDDVVGFRPLGVLSLVARFTLLGEHTKWHLAVVLASTVLLCTVIYLFLRTLRVEPLHAGAMALLVLVCPYADATRLWATGSGANLAISAWLLGVVVALRGLETPNRRKAIALHAAAVTLNTSREPLAVRDRVCRNRGDRAAVPHPCSVAPGAAPQRRGYCGRLDRDRGDRRKRCNPARALLQPPRKADARWLSEDLRRGGAPIRHAADDHCAGTPRHRRAGRGRRGVAPAAQGRRAAGVDALAPIRGRRLWCWQWPATSCS